MPRQSNASLSRSGFNGCVILLAMTWYASWPGYAAAQTIAGYKKGDAIQVYFLRSWLDAIVVDMNRTQVLAEFEFANSTKRETFTADMVRFPYEADALDRGRQWSDESGKFRVRAALIRIASGEVTLRKEDKTELKVPIDKLSSTDKSYLKRLEKNLGAGGGVAPAIPTTESFSDAAATTTSALGVNRTSLAPDPVPNYQRLKEGGFSFPVGGRGSYVLGVVENATPGGALPTRLMWAALEEKKLAGRQLLPSGEVVMDYHAASHRLLTHNMVDEQQVLSVWEVLPTDKEVKPVVRWNGDGGEWVVDPWARMVDANTVVSRFKKQLYVGWDIASKTMKYKIEQESFFAPFPTLSGSHRYLFLPEDMRVRVVDAVTGKLMSTMPADDRASGVAVSEDGTRAAVLGASTLTVWDLTNASAPPDVFEAEAVGSTSTASLAWVGDRQVMVNQGSFGQVLFSLDLRLPLWNYQFDSSAVREEGSRRLREIVDSHLVYAAAFNNGGQSGLAVGAVKLPGPKVEEVGAALDRSTLNVIKPGSAVSLTLKCGAHDAAVRAALEKQIADNGWTLSPTAATTMTAEMGRGQSQTVTYRMFDGSGDQSATLTPFFSSLKLEVGGKLAWQSGTSTGASPIIQLRTGETAQDQVNQWQNPNVEFFAKVDLPDTILDPDKRRGLGVTNVSTRGLEPQ
jgi:SLA1 homology domain 1, SHD1